MSGGVLVAYATNYGSTREVAEAIVAALRDTGVEADALPAKDVRTPEQYGAVILGAPLVMHHWHKDILRFLTRHRATLSQMPVAVFALGPVHEPRDEAEWQDARGQLDAELAKLPWFKPAAVEILGGKFDPALLRFPLNKLAGAAPASDARDWDGVRAWAERVALEIGAVSI